MIKKINITLFSLLLGALIFLPFQVSADAFSIHLSYNAKTKVLIFNKSVSEPVSRNKDLSISALEFAQNDTPGQYILKLYDSSNNEISSSEFDAQPGDFNLDIPYFSLAYSLKIIEKSSGKEMLNADLSQLSTCNGNGICELEKKENALNCIGDCGKSTNTYSDATKKALQENNGVIKNPQTGQIILQDKSFSTNSSQNQLPNSSSTQKINNSSSSSQSTSTTKTTSALSSSSVIILIIATLFLVSAVGFIVYKKFLKK